MPRHKYLKRKYKKPPRRSAKTTDSKARSMQTSWRHATNKTETLSLDEARKIIDAPPDCPYCKQPIRWKELSIDHVVPRSREGACESSNLRWVHRVCNLIKGDLTGDEFRLLLEFLDAHPTMKESITQRLRIAGATYGRWKRRRRR